MTRGFYTLASGMLSEQRRLATISNNVANVKTAGYKKQTLTTTTFDQVYMSRIEKGNSELFGRGSIIRYADELNVDYSQSDLNPTEYPFDVAIVGDGFFRIEMEGMEQPVLTRNGQFDLDAEGYLILPGVGRVMGEGGTIQLGGSNFTIDENGYIYTGESDSPIDRISVAYPADNKELVMYAEGMYLDPNAEEGAEAEGVFSTSFIQGAYENSNVDMTAEMTDMMASNRAFQSVSQAMKIMDKANNKATTEIGRV